MVTYPIDFPTDLGIESFEFGIAHSVGHTQSPFTFSDQVTDFGGQIFMIKVALPLMNRDLAEIYNSFILKLRGRKGTFLIGDPAGATPRGSFAGTPLVDGAGQTGDTIDLKGFDVSESNVIRAGDYFQHGTGTSARLHKFLEDRDSDSGGLVNAVAIAPDIRSSPADNDPITTTNARGHFRLKKNYTPISINRETQYSITFEAMEALDGT